MNSTDYFDSIAKNWNVIREEYFDEKLRSIVIGEEEIEGKICADLGCGTGFISLSIATKAQLVFALDQSRNMLSELKKEVVKNNLKNVFLIHGNMEKIPLFDNSIDYVFTNMALHHIKEPEKIFKEIFRILTKGGKLIVSDVKSHDGKWAIEEMHDVWLGFSDQDITQWMSKAGLTDISVKDTGIFCQGYSSLGEFTKTEIFVASATKE